MSDIKQVTVRQCCTALCDNTEQLLNIGCTACEDKSFAKKHYLCMECYMNLIITAKKEKRNPVCPLDRTPIKIDKQLCRMVETDILMDAFWQQVHQTYAGIMNLQRFTRNVRVVTPPRRREIRRQNAVHQVVTTPDPVVNVREAMEPVQLFTPARASFADQYAEARQVEFDSIVVGDESTLRRIPFPDFQNEQENMDPEVIRQWEQLIRTEQSDSLI